MKKKKFVPKKGQVDYTKIRYAPVINCVLVYKNKILLVQRSKDLKFYPNYWNGISGFLDDSKNLLEKIYEELREEVGLGKKDVEYIKFGKIFHQDESKYKKTCIVHPVLVRVKTDKIKLDWESERFQWLNPQKALKLKLLPGFNVVLKEVLVSLSKN